jgi:hypothetical protein
VKVKSIAAVILVLIAVVILILFAVYYARTQPPREGPDAIFSGMVKDSESSFNLTFGKVLLEDFHIENCSVAMLGNGSVFGPPPTQYFDLLTKRIALNLTEDVPPNSTETSWVGVNFTVQFVDINNDGLVSEGDNLRVFCNQPLRYDTYYAVFFGWYGSTICYEEYRT